MKKGFVTRSPGAHPVMRPSSARRLRNLRGLVAEFAGRDIGHTGVAVFLGCSLSAARNYVSELLDAGIVASHPVRQAAGCMDRTLYRLTVDPLAVHKYLAMLARSHGEGDVPEWDDAAANEIRPDPAQIHRNWSPANLSLDAPARRDPLVAALFGAAQAA